MAPMGAGRGDSWQFQVLDVLEARPMAPMGADGDADAATDQQHSQDLCVHVCVLPPTLCTDVFAARTQC